MVNIAQLIEFKEFVGVDCRTTKENLIALFGDPISEKLYDDTSSDLSFSKDVSVVLDETINVVRSIQLSFSKDNRCLDFFSEKNIYDSKLQYLGKDIDFIYDLLGTPTRSSNGFEEYNIGLFTLTFLCFDHNNYKCTEIFLDFHETMHNHVKGISRKKSKCYLRENSYNSKILDEESLSDYDNVLYDKPFYSKIDIAISKFLRQFGVSLNKFFLNQDYVVFNSANKSYVSRSLQELNRLYMIKLPLGFPDWFFWAFPDVILWYLIEDGYKEFRFSLLRFGDFTDGEAIRFAFLEQIVNVYKKKVFPLLECEMSLSFA